MPNRGASKTVILMNAIGYRFVRASVSKIVKTVEMYRVLFVL